MSARKMYRCPYTKEKHCQWLGKCDGCQFFITETYEIPESEQKLLPIELLKRILKLENKIEALESKISSRKQL